MPTRYTSFLFLVLLTTFSSHAYGTNTPPHTTHHAQSNKHEKENMPDNSNQNSPPSSAQNKQPLHQLNQDVFKLNENVIRPTIIHPISKTYETIVPNPLRIGLERAVTNLDMPLSFINYILQGEGAKAAKSLTRFIINTTLGVGGLADAASEMGITYERPTGFSDTLHKWGVPRGPFVVVPVFGPAVAREIAGAALDWFANPLRYVMMQKNINGDHFNYRQHQWIFYTSNSLKIIQADIKFNNLLETLKGTPNFYNAVKKIYLDNLSFRENQ